MADQATTIPKGWKMTTLEKVLIKRNQGVNTTTEKVEYSRSGIPVIRAQNISFGNIDFSDIVFIDEKTFLRLSANVKPEFGDILYTNIGSQMGLAAKVEKRLDFIIAWNVLRVVTNRALIDSDFLTYFFNNPITKQLIVNRNSSSTMPFVSGGSMDNLDLLLPSLSEQRAIAEVLSSLDDKIELLREQNKTLEATAQAIFKEWFVNFNFPGATGKMIDSELGEIPEGWKVGQIKDLIDILSGFAFQSSTFLDEGKYKLVTIKNVQDRNFVFDKTDKILEIPSRMPDYCRLYSGDILLSLTGNVGRVCLVIGSDFLLNQRVAKLRPKNETDYTFSYLLFLQDSVFNILQSTASGTAQQNLSPIQTKEIDIVIPNRKTLDKFGLVGNPLIKKVNENNSQIQTLSTFRNTILPKLIKGEIRVNGFKD